jgi:hypothetical protein
MNNAAVEFNACEFWMPRQLCHDFGKIQGMSNRVGHGIKVDDLQRGVSFNMIMTASSINVDSIKSKD